MPLSLNKPKLDNLAGDIWKSAERLRGKFKAYEYQSVTGQRRVTEEDLRRAGAQTLSVVGQTS